MVTALSTKERRSQSRKHSEKKNLQESEREKQYRE